MNERREKVDGGRLGLELSCWVMERWEMTRGGNRAIFIGIHQAQNREIFTWEEALASLPSSPAPRPVFWGGLHLSRRRCKSHRDWVKVRGGGR